MVDNAFRYLLPLLALAASAHAQFTQQWVARYSASSNGNNEASAIALDPSGRAYVTGTSPGGYATVAYDGSGNQLWVARYPAQLGGATAIVLDGAGNVYVTGYSGAATTAYATVSYVRDGNQRWVALYEGQGNLTIPTAIVVDGSANVYVTGRSDANTDASWEYATVSYDSNGNQRWVARYRVRYGGARAIALDNSGNIYVTGSGDPDGSGVNYVTVAYDVSGIQRWVARYPGNGADAIAVDSSGNVYVTGRSTGNAATVAYDADGNQLWVDDSIFGEGKAIAIAGSGNIIVSGVYYGSPDDDYLAVAYDSTGAQLWVSLYDGDPGRGGEEVYAMATDAFGGVYLTGPSQGLGTTNSDYAMATVAFDSGGNQLWAARYHPQTGDAYNYGTAIAVDASSNVYVTGFSRVMGNSEFVTIKYSQP